ncbi:MAG: hypothetical protein V4615_02010, partial [Bacteroidota bacterium]
MAATKIIHPLHLQHNYQSIVNVSKTPIKEVSLRNYAPLSSSLPPFKITKTSSKPTRSHKPP